MYNYMNAAYLAKLTYEISLSCPSFKNLSFENLSLCAYVWGAVWDISIFIHYKRREVKNKVGDPIYQM